MCTKMGTRAQGGDSMIHSTLNPQQISQILDCMTLVSFSLCHVIVQLSSVQCLSRVRLFTTPWTTAPQASLSITNSQSLFKLISIESVMLSNHLILCHPLILLPSIFPRFRVFSNESALHIWVAKVLEFQLQHLSFQ